MLDILFENSVCIVVNKPPGWLSVPGRTPEDQRSVLGKVLEQELGTAIFPVHRLDAEVSGAILYAKDREFHKDANREFENRTVHKTYQAITELGPFQKGDTARWTSTIVRGKKRSFEAAHGKRAVTEAEVVARGSLYLDWRLHPVTGRPHQLRFELTKHHCPILGDTLYGAKAPWPDGGIALRSLSLRFPEEFHKKWDLPERIDAPTFKVESL